MGVEKLRHEIHLPKGSGVSYSSIVQELLDATKDSRLETIKELRQQLAQMNVQLATAKSSIELSQSHSKLFQSILDRAIERENHLLDRNKKLVDRHNQLVAEVSRLTGKSPAESLVLDEAESLAGD